MGALVARVARELQEAPQRFLDPAAGDGRFGEAVAGLWPGCQRVAIEPRIEERRQLRVSHHRVVSRSFEDVADQEEAEQFDLIATNPPFRRAFGGVTWLPVLLRLLRPGGLLCLYARSTLGQALRTAQVFAELPPFLQIRVVGRVSHREHGRTDQHDTSGWCWRKGDTNREGWYTVQLEPIGTLRL